MNNWVTNDEFTTKIRMNSFVYSLRFLPADRQGVIRNLILTFVNLFTFGISKKTPTKNTI